MELLGTVDPFWMAQFLHFDSISDYMSGFAPSHLYYLQYKDWGSCPVLVYNCKLSKFFSYNIATTQHKANMQFLYF